MFKILAELGAIAVYEAVCITTAWNSPKITNKLIKTKVPEGATDEEVKKAIKKAQTKRFVADTVLNATVAAVGGAALNGVIGKIEGSGESNASGEANDNNEAAALK